jgi:host factor-I protein
MANRKLIRPDMNELKKELPARSLRRKQSPPEQTNAEEFYYLKQMAAKTPMVVILDGGEELRGWIEWYDKGAIKLNRHSGPNLLIQKQYIRYMFKEDELRRVVRSKKNAVGATASATSEGSDIGLPDRI